MRLITVCVALCLTGCAYLKAAQATACIDKVVGADGGQSLHVRLCTDVPSEDGGVSGNICNDINITVP